MEPTEKERDQIREKLLAQKSELTKRVDRIHEHARDPLDSDSAEQAAQLGNVAVVAALESEAVEEIAEIDAALQRISAGTYGNCVSCGDFINKKRLEARPASTECLTCAEGNKPD
jgi:DnaK suppressor protein